MCYGTETATTTRTTTTNCLTALLVVVVLVVAVVGSFSSRFIGLTMKCFLISAESYVF